jgi:signal peptidase I
VTDVDDIVVPPKDAEPESSSRLRSTIEWIVMLAAALAIAFVVKTFLIQAFWIPSASMFPTLKEGDRVLVNKLSYRLHDVNRGDLVVFERPDCDVTNPKDLIKRVIAVGGERVEAREGEIRIDGRRLDEPYLPDGVTTDEFGPFEVPADHIWVMGDNRGNSKDSRLLCPGKLTPIPEDDVVGRAFIRVWPFSNFTLL